MNIDKCPYCGNIHNATCPKLKAIEYQADGTVKRVEFFTPNDYPPLQIGRDPLMDLNYRPKQD